MENISANTDSEKTMPKHAGRPKMSPEQKKMHLTINVTPAHRDLIKTMALSRKMTVSDLLVYYAIQDFENAEKARKNAETKARREAAKKKKIREEKKRAKELKKQAENGQSV